MALRPSITSLALSLLILSTPAAGQTPQLKQESEEEKAKSRKELERKAFVLLDETLEGAQALKLPENRAAMRSQAADLLWPRDEKRARALFREAASDIASAQAAEGVKADRSFWMLTQLRAQLLFTAAARDPQLALDLLRESRPEAGADPAHDPRGDNQELRLEQTIGALAAEADPKVALRMAEESLNKGLTLGVLGVLEQLRQKDAEAATRLAGKIVERLRGESLSGGREAYMVGVSLLRAVLLPQEPQQYFYGPPPPPARGAEKPKPLVMEESAVRELADMVAGAALKDAASGGYGYLMHVRPLLPELEKRVPARAAQLRLKQAAAEKALEPRMRAWAQMETALTGSPDAILESAARAPAEIRTSLFWGVASKLLQSGETERARRVVADNLTGQEREQMLAIIDRAEVVRAVEKGNTEEAKAVVSRIRSKEGRASALADLAVTLALKGERKAATLLLEEARSIIDRRPDNEREVEALLEVARGYALVDPARTFEMIEPLIDHANDMLSAAALLEKFGAGAGLFRKGEMVLAPGLGEVSGRYMRHVKALAELARVDFDRTKATADRFQRDEARLMARLVIARSLLSDRLDAGADPAGGYATLGIAGVSR